MKRLALSQIAAAVRSQSRFLVSHGRDDRSPFNRLPMSRSLASVQRARHGSAVGENPEGEVPAVALANSKGEPQPCYAVQQVHGIQIADPHRA